MKRCRCHGEPMDRHSSSNGGWVCAVKRRDRQRRQWHEKLKHDPVVKLERQLRDMTRVQVRY